jgi:hypothetical protein
LWDFACERMMKLCFSIEYDMQQLHKHCENLLVKRDEWSYAFLLNMTCNNYINIVRACLWNEMNEVMLFYWIWHVTITWTLWDFACETRWWSYVFLLNMPCNNYINIVRTCLWNEMNKVMLFYWIWHVTIT